MDVAFSETQTPSPLSWGIGTDVQRGETSNLEGKDILEWVLKWAENQSSVTSESLPIPLFRYLCLACGI